jgi:CBS domain-containing protein
MPKSTVEYVETPSTVRQALEKMRYHHYAAIPVIDGDGVYLGTLRSDDIFRYFIDNGMRDPKAAEEDSVLDILDREYSKAIFHTASIGELIERVKEHNFVPVVDDRNCFIGIVLRRDVLDFLHKCYEESGK